MCVTSMSNLCHIYVNSMSHVWVSHLNHNCATFMSIWVIYICHIGMSHLFHIHVTFIQWLYISQICVIVFNVTFFPLLSVTFVSYLCHIWVISRQYLLFIVCYVGCFLKFKVWQSCNFKRTKKECQIWGCGRFPRILCHWQSWCCDRLFDQPSDQPACRYQCSRQIRYVSCFCFSWEGAWYTYQSQGISLP